MELTARLQRAQPADNEDFELLEEAMQEARKSLGEDGIPIGAVIVKDGQITGRGHNRRRQEGDLLAHAEINCLKDAFMKHGFSGVADATLYTTSMPCHMCAGAIIQFGITRVVCGEDRVFPHARQSLEQAGTEVIKLEVLECEQNLRRYIAGHAELWAAAPACNAPTTKTLTNLVELPYLNFYQYPPPEAASTLAKQCFEAKLELNRALPESEQFTVFVSIPYCRKRCNSCPFFKAALPKSSLETTLQDYIRQLELQIQHYANAGRYKRANCKAVYFGGGTASLLTANQVHELIDRLKGAFDIDNDVEITLEGNPADFTKAYLNGITDAGVTRISLGYQSDNDVVLHEKIGAQHSADTGLQALKEALRAGLRTVNVDLLYGVPGQSFQAWKMTLERVLALSPESITMYAYVVHKNTLSEKRIETGRLDQPISDAEKHVWYNYAKAEVLDAGYEENRKGNFAKPGHRQQYAHVTYCENSESIGLGAGAYSFINGYLFKATPSPEKFADNLGLGLLTSPDFQAPRATTAAMAERYTIQNAVNGRLNLTGLEERYGLDASPRLPQILAMLTEKRLARKVGNELILTDLGYRWLPNILYAFCAPEFRPKLLK